MELMLDPSGYLLTALEVLMMQGMLRSGGAFELPLPGFLADHAPINYSILAWNIYDRDRE